MIQKIFEWFWKSRIGGYKVVSIKGWNEAILSSPTGQRAHVWFHLRIWRWHIG